MSRRKTYLTWALPVLVLLMGLSACQNGFVGKIDLSVSGVPTGGVRNVVIAVRAVALGGGDSQTTLPLGIDVPVDLESPGQTLVLNTVAVPAGEYQWVRLDVDADESYVIADDGKRYPLDVPSGFKTEGVFIVGEGLT